MFAHTGILQKDGSKSALLHAKRVFKEPVERSFTIYTKELVQFIYHIGTLLNTVIGLLVINKPVSTGTTTPLNRIGAIITANQVNDDSSKLLAFTYKLRLVIRQGSKESEANSFNNGCFTCTIGSTNSCCATSKIQVDLTIAFNILQLDSCNQHGDVTQPSQQTSKRIDMKE